MDPSDLARQLLDTGGAQPTGVAPQSLAQRLLAPNPALPAYPWTPGAQQPSLMDQARQQYPVLNNYDIGYKNNIGGGPGYMESYVPGEEGTPENPRPKEFPLTQFGVENYRADSTPSDVMADITSHHLINVDPTVKQAYRDFTGSLEPWQHDILQNQYQYAQKNEGETRPYEAWRDASGLPGYFRGYAFQQWPADFNKRAYTPAQTQKLDQMMKYLKGGR